MPKALTHPCSQPRCPHMAPCPIHKTPRAVYDQQRGSSTQRGYGYNWQKMRLNILHRDPICQDPFRTGCHAPATQADHIIPKWAGGTDSLDNGEGLCESCHARKTRLEQGLRFFNSPVPIEWTQPKDGIPTLCLVSPSGNEVELYMQQNAPSNAVSIKEWPHLIESIHLSGKIA